jgi:pilus assembly protein Flp/PilA
MQKLIVRVHAFLGTEEGQDLIEYALIAALIALAATAAMTATGTSINGLFTQITGLINGPAA